MSATAEEVEFLKKQVDELSNLLHDYQEKYPPLTEKDRSSVQALVTPPWQVDPKLVSPIMVEYEATISSLNSQLENYKHQYKAVQKHADQLISENDRLTAQLQQTIEEKLQPLITTGQPADAELSAVDNLQTQLALVNQEKAAINDLLRSSQREVQRLEDELSELRRTNISNSHWRHLQTQHQEMKVKYTQTITQMSQELRLAQEEARRNRNDTEITEQKLLEFKRNMSNFKDNKDLQDRGRVIQSEEKVRGLELELSSKINEVADLNFDLDSLKDVVDTQLDQIRKLAKVCAEKDLQVDESTERVREAVQTAEDALLEKTEMSLALKNYQGEVDRLREELSILCDQAGKKTKEEVDKVQNYADIKIRKLNDTIELLQNENGTLQAELERSIREKRSVESELEKVYQEGIHKAYEDGGRYDQLSKRACDAERERDELKVKLVSMDAELKRTEMRMESDKVRLDRDVDRLSERVGTLQRDFDKVNGDRLRHLEEANASEELANKVRREAEASDRKHNKEMICMEHSMSMKQTEFEGKLRTMEDTHRTSLNKLREDVTNQQRSTNQWKEEYHMLSDKWEKTVQALRTEVSDKEGRINELTSLLREARDKTIEAESMMRDYTNQMRKIELRTKEAEKRAADAMTQVATKDRKIKQLWLERQQHALSASKHLQEANMMEATFRMSEIGDELGGGGEPGLYRPRSPSILGELSLNAGSAPFLSKTTRDRLRNKELFSDDLL